MPKSNKRKLPPLPPVRPAEIINSEEMAFAVQIFQAGLRGRMPTVNPETKGFETGDGAVARKILESLPAPLGKQFVVRGSRIAPKDTAVHRGLTAVMSHYQNHSQRESILTRIMAFYFLVNKAGAEALKPWQKKCDDDPKAVMLHPAVIDAVAKAPPGRYGQFDEKGFFRLVEKIAAEDYGQAK
jgi:hypothetical protein